MTKGVDYFVNAYRRYLNESGFLIMISLTHNIVVVISATGTLLSLLLLLLVLRPKCPGLIMTK